MVSSLLFLALASSALGDIINEAWANTSTRFANNDDLWTFHSRPDLQPPKLVTKLHRPGRQAEGYIFTAPYDSLDSGHVPATTYFGTQMGATIYDDHGEVVWVADGEMGNRKLFDVHPIMLDGSYHLQMVAPQDEKWFPYAEGAGLILNASYDVVDMVTSNDISTDEQHYRLDLHEFNIVDEGERVLVSAKYPSDTLKLPGSRWQGRAMEFLFVTYNLRTRKTEFTWIASHHVGLEEATNPAPGGSSENTAKFWDWFHLNSIDKSTKSGEYLVSARASDTLYFIDPEDGHVIWRLGGKNSSFEADFKFSRQHNSRIRSHNPGKNMKISFFDNAADDSGTWKPTAKASSLMIVELDLVHMKAKLLHQHWRPDGGHSLAKGNVEYLENGNLLGGWGENGYVSEYAGLGRELVWEGRFATARFANYRIYKAPFVGRPSTIPALAASAGVTSHGKMTTQLWASWNGATEVDEWRFFASDGGKRLPLGNTTRKGFETSFVAKGFHPIVYAEAVDSYDEVLGTTDLIITEIPLGFHDAADPTYRKGMESTEEKEQILVYSGFAFLGGVTFSLLYSRWSMMRLRGGGDRKWAIPMRKGK